MNYNNPYFNPYQQYPYTQPTQQQTPMTNYLQLTFINGIEGAKAFIVAPNQTIYLKDSDLSALVIFSTIIMDFIFIIWQGLTGISTAFSIIEQEEVLPYVNRNRILEKYLYYKNPDNPQQVKDYLIQMKRECKDDKE